MLERIRHRAVLAQGEEAIASAEALRLLAFHGRGGRDRHDPASTHLLIFDLRDDLLVGCLRLRCHDDGAALLQGYSAGQYDLAALAGLDLPMIEVGRLCIHPERRDPDILRLAWGMLARLVDRQRARFLVGCSSFAGTDPGPYRAAFARLAAHHQAPPDLRPARKAPAVLPLAEAGGGAEPAQALSQMPAALRSYLAMGGWVSDHAVIDHEMNTLHVFTAVEVAAIAPARQRQMRALAARLSDAAIDGAPATD
ncbi:GNAT family N-acetyltransferase [Pontibaca methylaminivorans]|uniref:L-ornithine N(alpha)-acyltransferase n=1 Tax=Pontibaca methylaminivorans TaxID=515897 RepID=A0A1R3X3Q9_9RHOB|nr:GNAT family N-acetyltransferase [Pontibaca methylaminivorans]SIT85215.1 ornithine-acyl[acyl carrier protein] N-acyltransferase [Pontibaca methylaminivorans]